MSTFIYLSADILELMNLLEEHHGNGKKRPRLCKNVFQRDRHSKLDWKSRFYAKSTSADVPINFRFNVDARTSILAKRFYTLWANSGL
ncbi:MULTISPECIES: hypothetical protein [Pseudomonas]|uniref:hypothetical protein n=1 Tax=Pseudomonas TaxID=286 RepID=UPI001CE090A6|nr:MULTISPECIES: hypothetical protein [Pseudomonas]MCA4964546.1 hypothetical protein [Pseudomonas sp. Y24-6]MCE0881966.1 hypothetical protein [Pseudomonas putida]MCE1083646.1 hypothetical protein [Pseudomonas asiatica]